MGTYVATLTLFSINGSPLNVGPGNNNAYYLDDPNAALDSSPDSATLAYALLGSCFVLDATLPAISFAGLPAGFTPTSASIRQKGSASTSPGIVKRGSTENTSQIITTYGVWGGPVTNKATTAGVSFPTVTGFGAVPSAFDLTSFLTFALSQIRVHVPSDASLLEQVYSNIEIFGSYTLQQSQFQLENPSTPVRAGDKVKFNSSVPTAISQVKIDYTDPVTGANKEITINQDSYYIIIWGPTEFWFYLPIELHEFSGIVTITIVGDGTQFSGSVPIGFLQVLYEDASGIYNLVKTQTSDILYFRSGFTTDARLIFLPNLSEDELTFQDDLFSLLQYPYKILSQSDSEQDDDQGDYTVIASLRSIVLPFSVEIPSPFARTSFLP